MAVPLRGSMWTSLLSSGDLKPSVIDDADMRVLLYGKTAMVTGKEHLEGRPKGIRVSST